MMSPAQLLVSAVQLLAAFGELEAQSIQRARQFPVHIFKTSSAPPVQASSIDIKNEMASRIVAKLKQECGVSAAIVAYCMEPYSSRAEGVFSSTLLQFVCKTSAHAKPGSGIFPTDFLYDNFVGRGRKPAPKLDEDAITPSTMELFDIVCTGGDTGALNSRLSRKSESYWATISYEYSNVAVLETLFERETKDERTIPLPDIASWMQLLSIILPHLNKLMEPCKLVDIACPQPMVICFTDGSGFVEPSNNRTVHMRLVMIQPNAIADAATVADRMRAQATNVGTSQLEAHMETIIRRTTMLFDKVCNQRTLFTNPQLRYRLQTPDALLNSLSALAKAAAWLKCKWSNEEITHKQCIEQH